MIKPPTGIEGTDPEMPVLRPIVQNQRASLDTLPPAEVAAEWAEDTSTTLKIATELKELVSSAFAKGLEIKSLDSAPAIVTGLRIRTREKVIVVCATFATGEGEVVREFTVEDFLKL